MKTALAADRARRCVVTGLAVAYIVWKIDLRKTVDVLRRRRARGGSRSRSGSWSARCRRWPALAVADGGAGHATTASGGSRARTSSRTRRGRCCRPRSAATRCASSRRRGGTGGRTADVTALGAARARARRRRRRSCSAASGSCSRSGSYDVGAYLWVEGVFVARHARARVRLLRALGPAAARARACRCCARLRVERPCGAFYEGVHDYRGHPRLLARRVRVHHRAPGRARARDLGGGARRSGIELGPRIYYVMGPLLFLVMLVPFTINGFAVREAFFVSFLGSSASAPTRRSRPGSSSSW